MNKELVNKYWKEFCHWKDGGKLLYTEDLVEWCDVPNEYKWDIDVCDWVVLIINDEYVEYRKAVVEGKQLEWYAGGGHWIDYDLVYPFHCTSVNKIRVKPE